MLKAAETHLTGEKRRYRAWNSHYGLLIVGLADWYVPTGGMFLWLKVRGVNDTYKMIVEKALSKKVCMGGGAIRTVSEPYFTILKVICSGCRAGRNANCGLSNF